MKNLREIFAGIANLGVTLDAALTRAAADGADYGPAGADVERRRAAGVWKRSALAFLDSVKSEIESLRQQAAVDSRSLIDNIRNGRGPSSTRPASTDTTYMTEESKAQIRASEAAAATMATVASQLAFTNTLTVRQLESTAQLRELLAQYLADAERESTFDYQGFSIDARIVPLILLRRADGGDGLANLTIQQNYIGRTETALLRRGGLELTSDQDLRLFEQVREAVIGLEPATLRGLDGAQEVLALVQRLIGLKVVESGPRELPAPRHRSQAVTNPDWIGFTAPAA